MSIQLLFAGIPVADYDAALGWYRALFGREPDMVVAARESMWQVAATGWVYVVEDAGRAGSALVTLLVDDLDALAARLETAGLALGPIETMAEGPRALTLTDGDGNQVKIFEMPAGAS